MRRLHDCASCDASRTVWLCPVCLQFVANLRLVTKYCDVDTYSEASVFDRNSDVDALGFMNRMRHTDMSGTNIFDCQFHYGLRHNGKRLDSGWADGSFIKTVDQIIVITITFFYLTMRCFDHNRQEQPATCAVQIWKVKVWQKNDDVETSVALSHSPVSHPTILAAPRLRRVIQRAEL